MKFAEDWETYKKRMTKKPKCLNCGKLMKPEYDYIAKKVTGYLYSCKCSPKTGMSIG